jgi:hypothetical protein
MRESQMKKIIAAAVAAAFVAPVYAADITLSGDLEWSYSDGNGATSTALDGDVNINASTETANGLSVTTSINLSDNGDDDGGDAVTIGGDFGKLTLGDTSSAVDKFDDRNDYALVAGTSLTGDDAAVGWDLPTLVPGAKLYVSYGADTNEDGNEAHTGFGVSYGAGPVSVAYAQNNNDDGSKITYVGGTATFGGIAVSVETMDDDADDSEERSVGFKYSMGDVTIYGSNQKDTTDDATTADVTAFGVQYSLGGGVVAFVENSSDEEDASAETTALGVSVKF